MQTVSPHAHYFSKNYNNVKITQKFVVRKPKHQILYNIIFMILSCKCKCQETAGHDNNDMSNKIDALSPIPTPVVFLGFILSSEKGFNNPHLFELVETSSVWFPVFSLLLHSRNLSIGDFHTQCFSMAGYCQLSTNPRQEMLALRHHKWTGFKLCLRNAWIEKKKNDTKLPQCEFNVIFFE